MSDVRKLASHEYLIEIDPEHIDFLSKPGSEAKFKVGGFLVRVTIGPQRCRCCGQEVAKAEGKE